MCVIASGASAPAAIASTPRGIPALAVNRGFELAPWADCLYGADAAFWKAHPGALSFPGLKFSASADKLKSEHDVRPVTIAQDGGKRVNCPVRDITGVVGAGGNSGFQAVNLAAQFGAGRIVLIGFDFTGGHWHPDHKRPLRNPSAETLALWRNHMDAAAAVYRAWGVEVVNGSAISALKEFPKVHPAEVFGTSRALEAA